VCVDILFADSQLEKECNTEKRLVRRYGDERARHIKLRLSQLRAANTLEELRFLPQAKCHELHGDRAGQLSVTVGYPYNLIFEPVADCEIHLPDGGLNWKAVTAIRVLGVENYHG
jgi:proteic killer suppression protein